MTVAHRRKLVPGEPFMTDNNNHRLIVFNAVVAALGGFLFGYDSGVINGTIDGLRLAFGVEDIGTGFNVASMLLGCAIGAFFAGQLADLIGRKPVLLIAAVFFIVSAWGSGIAAGSGEFIFYRILGGLAVGAASVITPAYISEVSPTPYRGMLTTIQQVAIILGLFAAFISNYLIANLAGSSTQLLWGGFEAWRWMFWMELIPAALFLLLLLFIPESPRYLVVSGRRQTAVTVLSRLYGHSHASVTLVAIEQSLETAQRPRLADLLERSTGRVRRIVWVGVGLAIFQQLVGINVVFYYGAVLWQAVGFSEADALLINVLSGGLSLTACVITILVVDRIGRKPLLKWGSLGMFITLALMALAFTNVERDASGQLQLGDWGTVALLSANAYVFIFNMTWGPVMWVMLGEMFPNQIRGSGLAVSGLAQWLANFAITMTFPVMLAGVGLAAAYGFYALAALVSMFFVIVMVHETKGIALEEMVG